MRNKRQFLRLMAHHLLKYRLIGEDSREGALSFVRNISAGGVLFHSSEYIKPGSILELTINFPPPAESIKIMAKTLRVRELKTIGGFDVAVQFLNLDEATKKFIDRNVERVFFKTEEDYMKILSSIFIILAVIAGVISLSTKFNLIPTIFFNASTWLNITNTSLFFSIAISLLGGKANN